MAEQIQKHSQFKGQPRLPKFAVPKRYDLKLKPDLIACKFSGAVQISVDVVSDTKFLVLNAAELSIIPKSVTYASGSKQFILDLPDKVDLYEKWERSNRLSLP
ncbi:AP-1 complex subunit mu-1-like [Castilleja foliolosa]|uniref:AP-1 complex subunit mu-1-like n=1 Tax=Castilleja foliolosa TaxID=1961234 RepID=A0ABD3EMT1_9LAMI